MKDRLIKAISRRDLLLDFMDKYDLFGLRYATEEQLKEYCHDNNIKYKEDVCNGTYYI